ncbi:MAG: hypothetical protein DRI86_10135 [Bacteroidetes bacterium]|nr:MAG: hypothetical protein DRI86_10135 [Bacteroidota bacterium]
MNKRTLIYINRLLLIITIVITISNGVLANVVSSNIDSLILPTDNKTKTLSNHYLALVDSFAENSQYDSAYIQYVKYIAIRDSIYEQDRLKSMDNLIEEYKAIEYESQAKFLSQKLWNRTLILIFSIFLVILIAVLLIVTYSRNKLKSITYAKETIALNMTIEEKNKELVSIAMDQNQQYEIYESIRNNISSLKKDKDLSSLKQYILSLKKDLSKKKKAEMSWDSFKMHFEQVHPDYFDKLLLSENSLTQNDLRICAYIKLNLSTKDIANILNISNRAIQTSRYRIKKKLNLSPETDFVKYIQGI